MVSVSRPTPSPHIMATETLAVQEFIKINNQPTSERRIEQWIDKLFLNEKDKCDKALAYFFYRTGVCFRIIDSSSFRKFIKTLRPSYEAVMPTRRALSEGLLESTYLTIKKTVDDFLSGCKYYSVITDGWSNIRNEQLLTKCVFVVKFIKERHRVLARFRELQDELRVSKQLSLPCATRWYSNYGCLSSLSINKSIISLLAIDKVADDAKPTLKRDEFISYVSDKLFWEKIQSLKAILKKPSEMIGLFECDTTDLSSVYSTFYDLFQSYRTLASPDNEEVPYSTIVKKRWNLMHTSCMGFAHILSPKNCDFDESMVGTDRVDTIFQLRAFVAKYFEQLKEVEECNNQITGFLAFFALMTYNRKLEYLSRKPLHFWAVYGKHLFPLLSKVALRVLGTPTSSAASERFWSIFAFIHSKNRNRLSVERADKLVFIYCNAGLLDNTDHNDYFADFEFV